MAVVIISTVLFSCKGEKKEKIVVKEEVKVEKTNMVNNLDLTASVMTWKGTKPTGAHDGTIAFKESSLVLDNGKITGANGKEADARNCILILTTNLGAKEAEKNTIGFDEDFDGAGYEDKELKKFFAPEFRNRLDATITFAKLGKEIMMKIVGKFLVELKNMVKDKQVDIIITDEALDQLVEKGFDSKMGARPLQRVIDKDIKRPLSKEILFGSLKAGGNIEIAISNDSIVLLPKENVETVAV